MTPGTATKTVRQGLERACAKFSESIVPLGFTRTRLRLWTRSRLTGVCDWIDLFRNGSSYGAPRNYSVDLRLTCGIRVLADPGDALLITSGSPTSEDHNLRYLERGNPSSPEPAGREDRLRRYHLRFNSHSGSTYERCIEDLSRIVRNEVEPWLHRWPTVEQLITHPGSPLTEAERALLAASVAGGAEITSASRRVLGFARRFSPPRVSAGPWPGQSGPEGAQQ